MIIDRALAAELRKMSMGTTLGFSKFFELNEKFVAYMKQEFDKKLIYDVGAGAGHVTDILRDKGMKVIGIDVHVHQAPEIEVLIADGTVFQYEPKSVVMVCRPCHGMFAEHVIDRAIECKASTVLYVGLHRNVADDLDKYLPKFKEVAKKVGNDGESIWRMDTNEKLVRS